MILYYKDPKDFSRKLSDFINAFSNIAVYKTNTHKVSNFYLSTMTMQKNKSEEYPTHNSLKRTFFHPKP